VVIVTVVLNAVALAGLVSCNKQDKKLSPNKIVCVKIEHFVNYLDVKTVT